MSDFFSSDIELEGFLTSDEFRSRVFGSSTNIELLENKVFYPIKKKEEREKERKKTRK